MTGNRVTNAYTGSLNFDLPYTKSIITTGLKSSYLTNIVGFDYFNILNSILHSIPININFTQFISFLEYYFFYFIFKLVIDKPG